MTDPTPAPEGGTPAPQPAAEQRAPITPTPEPAPRGGDPAPAPEAKAGDPKPEDKPAYKVPDAYKDKPWAKNIKSDEDLWKEVDGLTTLKGKKHVAPDFKTAKPEEIEAFFATTRPADKAAYTFADGADEGFKTGLADAMWDAGISEHQYGIIKGKYDAIEAAALERATSSDGFNETMTKNFGEKFDDVVVRGQAAFKTHLTEDQGKLLNVMPNEYIAPLYQLVNSYEKQIADMKEKYGVKENPDAHTGDGGNPSGTDVDTVRKDLRGKIAAMEKGPHTAEAKQKLVDQLDKTYRTPATTTQKR